MLGTFLSFEKNQRLAVLAKMLKESLISPSFPAERSGDPESSSW